MVEARDLDIIFKSAIDWEVFRNSTILITAATGRLGMYFVEALSKADVDYNLNMRIIAHARDEKKLKRTLERTLDLPNVRMLIQDITEPFKIEEQVDYIIHTAGPAAPKDFTDYPVDTLKAHTLGTLNVLDLAVDKKSKKVVYVSTVEIYGENTSDHDFKEEEMGILYNNTARACYPEAKRLCETMLASYQAQYGIDYLGVRMSHTFGPGISLSDGRSFAEFIKKAINGEDIVLHTDGSAVRPYTYVADAIGAILLAVTRGDNNTFYNVANNDNQISTKDLAYLIAELDQTKQTKVVFEKKSTGTLKYLPFKLGMMDTTKIRKLGWRSYVGLNDAFRYTVESFIQQGIH